MLRLAAALAALGLALAAPAAAQEEELVQSHLRKAVVTLPAGVSLSPSAAAGMAACTDAQLRLGQEGPPDCPNASKVGTVQVTSSPLPEGLSGAIYVREPVPGQMFRIALTMSGNGIHVKLPGAILPDPATGQVVAVFDELPQLPFDSVRMSFFGGPRAALANPLDCGTYGTVGVFTPWSGTPPVTSSSVFEVGQEGGCPRALPFDPAVTAGTVDAVAGAFSPFVFRVRREDGRQELQRIDVDMPPGLTAAIRSVPLCPAARAAAGDCGEESRVGTATVGAGPGPSPLYLTGATYLTEPYAGAPFGLAIVTRAVAGPFDLGTVVVRAAVHVNRRTAELSVRSDPIPRIVGGVPLRLRDVHLAIDRPGFMKTPTSCAVKQVRSSIAAVQGAVAPAVSRFQVGGCERLRFKPRMRVRLLGPDGGRLGTKMGLRVRLRARPGDANLRSVSFTLPPEVAFDARRQRRLCSPERLDAGTCPRGTLIGRARAFTPLLAQRLEGPVYFVKGDPFPKLAMLLDGPLPIDIFGSTDVTGKGLLTSFSTVPDVPISRFRLDLDRGMFTPTRNLCRGGHPRAVIAFIGQNGRRLDRRPKIALPCRRR